MKRLRIIAASAALALSSGSGEAASPPQRVMSINLCTDQLILQLLPPERVTSVSFLSSSSENAYLTAEAFGVPVNYGTSEEVLRQNPDLVVAGTTTTAAVRALLKRIGRPLVEVPPAENFDQIRGVTRAIARAVGEEEKGERLLAEMDAVLAELAGSAPPARIVVAGWDGAGNVPLKGTLFDSILAAAGGVNVAADITTNIAYGQVAAFDLEQLLAMRPDIVALGNSRIGKPDLASEQLQHRIVRRLYAGRQITYPETLYSCGLPQSAAAARDLRRAMLDIMRKQRSAARPDE
jgi:iron complex transport system substrate-binding protein